MTCDVKACDSEEPEPDEFSFDEIPSNNNLVDQIQINLSDFSKVGTCVIVEDPVNIQIVEFNVKI